VSNGPTGWLISRDLHGVNIRRRSRYPASSEPAERGGTRNPRRGAAGPGAGPARGGRFFDVPRDGAQCGWIGLGTGLPAQAGASTNWLVVLVRRAMSETLTFSEALGLEPRPVFLETIAGGGAVWRRPYADDEGQRDARTRTSFRASRYGQRRWKDAELATSAAPTRHGAGTHAPPMRCCPRLA